MANKIKVAFTSNIEPSLLEFDATPGSMLKSLVTSAGALVIYEVLCTDAGDFPHTRNIYAPGTWIAVIHS